MSSLGINFDNDMKVNEYMKVDYSHSSPTLVIDKPSDKSVALNFPSVDYVEKPADKFTLTIDNIIADTINFDTQDGRKERKFIDDGIFGTKSDDWGHLPYYDNYVPIVTANYTKLDSTINNDTAHTNSANCYTFINIDLDNTDDCIIQFKYIKASNDNINIGFTDDNSDLSTINTNLFSLSELGIDASGIIKIIKIKDKIHFYLDNVWKATEDFTLDDNYVFSFNYNNKVFYFRELSMDYIDIDYDINKNDYNVKLVDSSQSTEDNIIYNNNVRPISNYDTGKFENRILYGEVVEMYSNVLKNLNIDNFNELEIKPEKNDYWNSEYGVIEITTTYDDYSHVIIDIIDDTSITEYTNMKSIIVTYDSYLGALNLVYYNGYDRIAYCNAVDGISVVDGKGRIGLLYKKVNNEIIAYPCYYDYGGDEWIKFEDYFEEDIVSIPAEGIIRIREHTFEASLTVDFKHNQILPVSMLKESVDYIRETSTYDNNIYNYKGSSELIANEIYHVQTENPEEVAHLSFTHGGKMTGNLKIFKDNNGSINPIEFTLGRLMFVFEVNTMTSSSAEMYLKIYYFENNIYQKTLLLTDNYSTNLNNGVWDFNISVDVSNYTDNYPHSAEIKFYENNQVYKSYNLIPSSYDVSYISYFNDSSFYLTTRLFDSTYSSILIYTYNRIYNNAINALKNNKSEIVSNPFSNGKIKMVYTTDLSTNLLFEFYDDNNYHGFKIGVIDSKKCLYYTSEKNEIGFDANNIKNYQTVIGYLKPKIKYYLEFDIDNETLYIKSNNKGKKFYIKGLANNYYNDIEDVFISQLKDNQSFNIRNSNFINTFINGNWNIGCGFISNIIYEIPVYESSLYSITNNIINIYNSVNEDTIHLMLNHDFYGDNLIYMKFDDKSSNNDYEKINIIFTSNKKINIALSDLYIDSDEFFFEIKDGKIIIYTYDDATLTEVYNEVFDLEDNFHIIISGGDTTTICNLDIITFLVGKTYQEVIDDGIKNYNNAKMVGSIDADVSADINGTTLQCSRVVGNGYLLPTIDGDYNNHLLINGSSEIEFDYIYHEDLYDHNKFGIGNRIGNQVEYITFNELDIDTDKHIKIKVTNDYEQIGVNDMTANIKVYTAPISETNVYTNNDYTLKYDKDVSISLLRAGYYFLFKQQNRTSKIQYRNFSINVVCYDYNIIAVCRGYTKEGVLDMYRSYEEQIPCVINTNENRLKVSFGNSTPPISKDVKYIEFYIIFADDRLTKIEISNIMLSEGIEDAPYSKDLKEENLKNSSIDFTRSYYCNYYNHHEADPVGLCIIRPTMESINLTKIPAPLRDDGKGNQGTTILYPYLKNCKDENKPENVAVEYLNSCDQTLKCEYSG